ncbi:MAG TPA: type II toxin-antitoxin system VapB family antitoxin [Acidimicrobiales bacterium]|jgi:Arc/MetJ family transcription regulator|nr:type II toxin-antitoxin system VapB family antitoxin [Acidimicrobiales bacterium]
MKRRTTIEIDDQLLARARQALGGSPTTRATVEEALRQLADRIEHDQAERAERQRRYLDCLGDRIDPTVLSSEEMWR